MMLLTSLSLQEIMNNMKSYFMLNKLKYIIYLLLSIICFSIIIVCISILFFKVFIEPRQLSENETSQEVNLTNSYVLEKQNTEAGSDVEKNILTDQEIIEMNTKGIDIGSIISKIKIHVDETNNSKDLKIKKLDNTQLSNLGYHPTDNGQEITGYFKGDELVKIDQNVGLSFGLLSYQYYFLNDQLIFVYKKEQDFPYDENLETFDSNKLELGFEKRYYFNDEKLIKIIEGEKGKYAQSYGLSVKDLFEGVNNARKTIINFSNSFYKINDKSFGVANVVFMLPDQWKIESISKGNLTISRQNNKIIDISIEIVDSPQDFGSGCRPFIKTQYGRICYGISNGIYFPYGIWLDSKNYFQLIVGLNSEKSTDLIDLVDTMIENGKSN